MPELTDAELANHPVPSWLDLSTEIRTPGQPEAYKKLGNNPKAARFIAYCMGQLLNNGLVDTPEQAFEVVGNLIAETGWGRSWNGWNFGGWKCVEAWAKAYKKKNGVGAPWFRARGHVKSGDTPVVFYRGFSSGSEFIEQWIAKFVPVEGTVASTERYYKTGKAFWAGGDWFRELCLSGYKGAVTQKAPDKSVQAHVAIVKRAKVMYAQWALGLIADGMWGKQSKEAAKQRMLTLDPVTGFLTAGSLEQLVLNSSRQTPTQL